MDIDFFDTSNEELPQELMDQFIEKLVTLGVFMRLDDGTVIPNLEKFNAGQRLAFQFETDEEGNVVGLEMIGLDELPPELTEH